MADEFYRAWSLVDSQLGLGSEATSDTGYWTEQTYVDAYGGYSAPLPWVPRQRVCS